MMVMGTAAIGAEVKLPAPGMEGWQSLVFPGVEKHTRYTVVNEHCMDAVKAEAECSASGLFLPIDIDARKTPRLEWAWKVEQPLSDRGAAREDFAARVFVLFAFDPARASWWQRLQHGIGALLYRQAASGPTIHYVWSASDPVGTVWDGSGANAKMVSLGSAPRGDWRKESVDVVGDYRKLFGTDPPQVLGVALSTDADHSCQSAVAYFAELRFVGAD